MEDTLHFPNTARTPSLARAGDGEMAVTGKPDFGREFHRFEWSDCKTKRDRTFFEATPGRPWLDAHRKPNKIANMFSYSRLAWEATATATVRELSGQQLNYRLTTRQVAVLSTGFAS